MLARIVFHAILLAALITGGMPAHAGFMTDDAPSSPPMADSGETSHPCPSHSGSDPADSAASTDGANDVDSCCQGDCSCGCAGTSSALPAAPIAQNVQALLPPLDALTTRRSPPPLESLLRPPRPSA
ncbi:hypothetical protein [Wenzhouxiangella marina]|uniref:hypothetical protein n=1 Tax=Wenzhouxiangella marina TaxID=1579979 RepID=UPI0006730E97|nr:hypothetical protein [Wenzhouxiangella marina]MBB6086187.1 hypothetical protein [Wenzhouxiangella marina]